MSIIITVIIEISCPHWTSLTLCLCFCLPSTVRLKASKSKEMHCTARNPTLRHSTATPRPSVSEAASDNDVLGLSGIKSTTDFNQNQSLTCMLYCTLCYTLSYIPVCLGISPLMGPGCCLGLCNFPCEAACAMGFFFLLLSPRCLPQKCQLLWQQSSHPHDALPLQRGPGGFPAGCAAGWMFHEG